MFLPIFQYKYLKTHLLSLSFLTYFRLYLILWRWRLHYWSRNCHFPSLSCSLSSFFFLPLSPLGIICMWCVGNIIRKRKGKRCRGEGKRERTWDIMGDEKRPHHSHALWEREKKAGGSGRIRREGEKKILGNIRKEHIRWLQK